MLYLVGLGSEFCREREILGATEAEVSPQRPSSREVRRGLNIAVRHTGCPQKDRGPGLTFQRRLLQRIWNTVNLG